MLNPYPQRSRWVSSKLMSLFLVAFLIGTVSLLTTLANRTPKIVHHGSSTSYSTSGKNIGSNRKEVFPSLSGANETFNEMLEESKGYQEFTPCFDDRGKLIGQRAIMWMHSPPPTKAFWRIVWTEKAADYSQLNYSESDSLDNARELERKENWRICRTTNY